MATRQSRTNVPLLICAMLAVANIVTASAQTNRFFQNRVHDPSTIVRCGDEFWTFATGDGIKALHSTNLTDWQFSKPALAANPPWAKDVATIHRDYFWAPDIIQSNDRYLLYFSVSSWGKNTSAIGLATNVTLAHVETGNFISHRNSIAQLGLDATRTGDHEF